MNQSKNKKKLGLWMSTSLVIGNMIGAGVFLMPAALAPYGGISIIGWLLSAGGAILLALVFSKLSKLVPNVNGGPYAYSRLGFGDFVGFLVSWGYWISIWVSNAAIAIAFVSALSVFFPSLETNSLLAVSTGLGAIWFLTWVNSRGVRESGKMQLLTTVIKIIPLVIIICGGFFFFEARNLIPFNPSGKSSFEAIGITATLTLYAFLGVESATIPAGNIKNPESTIPRATKIGTLLTTLLYILSTVVVMGIIPMEVLSKSPAPIADAMAIISGDFGRYIVGGGAAIAAFGALNGWILIQGQIAMATAKDQLFPPVFKKENKEGVPLTGLIIGSILSSMVMLMNYTDGLVEQFSFMILLTTLTCLIPYLFSAAAYVIISISKNPHNQAGAHILGGAAFVFTLWAIFGSGEKTVFWGVLLLLAGVPVYVWMKLREKTTEEDG